MQGRHQPLGIIQELDESRLSCRRRVSLLTKFYNIRTEDRSLRLGRANLQTVGERNPRARRRTDDYTLLPTNSEQLRKSFLPTAIREWNDLHADFREAQSAVALKNKLKHKPRPNKVYGEEYDRGAAINLTRLRCHNGNLNENLYNKQISVSPNCTCGAMESDTHYFETCRLFQDEREEAKPDVDGLPWTTEYLYHGSLNLTEEENIRLTRAAQKFIILMKRFV